MIKRTIILCKILVLIISLFVLTGCNDDPYKDKKNVVVETDYFYVRMMVDGVPSPYALILELTELGKEQEILVIPDCVEGLPVEVIGKFLWPNFRGLESENLKKVYVPITVDYIQQSAFSECPNFEELVILSVPLGPGGAIDPRPLGGQAIIVYCSPLTENLIFAILKPENVTIPVNLFFYYNYIDAPNSGFYWFDYITGTNLYRLPEDPIKDDSTFTGWYIDEECSIEWDEVLPASDTEIIELYAGWE